MSVEERRNARKRRILENLDKRMEKITGNSIHNTENNKNPMDETQFLTSTPIVSNEKDEVENIFYKPKNVENSSRCQFQLYKDMPLKKEESYPIEKILFNAELHIILTAIVSSALYKYIPGIFLFGNLMVPFYTLQIAQMGLGINNATSYDPTMLITVLGVFGFSYHSVMTMMAKIIMLWYNMAKDLCLYVFVIIFFSNVIG